MNYKEIPPSSVLAPYIHTFWELTGEKTDKQWERNFPDGCAGIVVNLGDTCITDNGLTKMDFGKTYAVGAMTSYKDSFIKNDTHLFGVCLKPGAFSNFYNFAPQSEILDQTIQFGMEYACNIDKFIKDPIRFLNGFFIERLQRRRGGLESVIEDIHQTKGQVGISEIAKKNFITVRQLERKFKTHLGVSPKEYANVVRFQYALSKIRETGREMSLLDIAIECGYYDHSHLANDIKRNTGMIPSQL